MQQNKSHKGFEICYTTKCELKRNLWAMSSGKINSRDFEMK